MESIPPSLTTFFLSYLVLGDAESEKEGEG